MGFKELIHTIKESLKPIPFDVSVFNHPVATKTDWSPKARGGANFQTRTLIKTSEDRLVYKGSTGMKIFSLLFIIFPVIAILIIAYKNQIPELTLDSLHYLIFLLFPIAGMIMYYYGTRLIVIDRKMGYLFKGHDTNQIKTLTVNPKWVELKKIVAIQLLPERIRSSERSYTSYELNFVFDDGERYNVIDHGRRSSIESDAQDLSEFLGVPVWSKMSTETLTPSSKLSDKSAYDSKDKYADEDYSVVEQDLNEDYDSLKKRKL